MDILTVRVYEVQPILTHARLQSCVLKVTRRRTPVAVVFPGDRVAQVLAILQSDYIEMDQESLPLKQAGKAFNSYEKLLAPRLSEGDCLISITSRQHVIAGIVSWKLWSHFVAKGDTSWLASEVEFSGERVLALVAARNRLTDLPEYFAAEQVERGSSGPIQVTKYGHHVFTIVPCHMNDPLLQLLLSDRRGKATTQERSQKALRPSGERSLAGGQGIAEPQLRLVVELTRKGFGLPVVAEALKEGDTATLRACFWQRMLELSDAQRYCQLEQTRPEGERQGWPGPSLTRENFGLWLRLIRLSAYALQIAKCLVALKEDAEWRYLLAYFGKYEELDVGRATKGLLAILTLCQIDQQVQQEVEQGRVERVESALVGLVYE